MKRPGTLGSKLHQDYPSWESLGIAADDMLTAAIAIDGAAAESGAMEIVAGQARRVFDRRDEPRELDLAGVDLAAAEMPALAAGDLLLSPSLAPYKSGSNRSGASRRLLLPGHVGPRHGDVYRRDNDAFVQRKLAAGGRDRPVAAPRRPGVRRRAERAAGIPPPEPVDRRDPSPEDDPAEAFEAVVCREGAGRRFALAGVIALRCQRAVAARQMTKEGERVRFGGLGKGPGGGRRAAGEPGATKLPKGPKKSARPRVLEGPRGGRMTS